jgi:hypothetical protein
MYIEQNYPEFQDIKIWNFPTGNLEELQDAIVDFVTDPAHINYRWIDGWVRYETAGPSLNVINGLPTSIWASATIIYTE